MSYASWRIAAALALVPALATPAQRPGGLSASTVVIVSGSTADGTRDAATAFRRRLEQRGVRVTEVSLTDSAAASSALRVARPDLVLALGSRAQELARRAAPGSTLVSALISAPSEPGGGQGAGVWLDFTPEQQLASIRRILPATQRRIGIVHSAAGSASVSRLRDLARAQGFEVITRLVQHPSDIPVALTSLTGGADVLWGIPDPMVMTPETARSILLFSLRNRLPMIGLSAAWVKSGALLALDRDYADIGAQCADQALRLLNGEPPATVMAERPRRMVYQLNQRTADLMAVRFSAEALRNASEVVR